MHISVISRGGGAAELHSDRVRHHPRCGPKNPTPLLRRSSKLQPTTRSIKSYTRERKLRVCQWLQDIENYVLASSNVVSRVREGLTLVHTSRGWMRPPNDDVASKTWHVPHGTVGQ
jgi:hypothetical protein